MTAPYGYKEFQIGDLFDIRPTKSTKLSKETGNTPVLSNTSTNNGIKCFVNESATEKGNVVTFSDTTDSIYTVFYQKSDFIGFSHVQVLIPTKYIDDWNEKTYLFFISAFKKAIGKYFTYGNKFNRTNASKIIIVLPVTPNGTPDFDYMTQYIAELETQYIAELETYLKVTGLDDYTLTDSDKDVLSRMADGRVPMGEFRIGDLFEKLPFKNKLNFNKQNDISVIRTKEFNLPLINAKHGENGIMYYGRDGDYESESMTIGVVNDGAISTGDVYPHPEKTGVLYNAYLIKPLFKTVSSEMLMYFACSLGKAIKLRFAYDKKATWDRISNVYITLPITIDGIPDCTFMEQYIRAVEKQVIAKLYDSHTIEIQTAKEIINSDN